MEHWNHETIVEEYKTTEVEVDIDGAWGIFDGATGKWQEIHQNQSIAEHECNEYYGLGYHVAQITRK